MNPWDIIVVLIGWLVLFLLGALTVLIVFSVIAGIAKTVAEWRHRG